MAGLLRFQNSDLAEARDGLGRMALTLSTEMNAQQKLGVDLDGNAGTNLFQPIAIPDAQPNLANTGTATVGAAVADTTRLVPSSYQIKFGVGGSIEVQRLSDGTTTNFTGPMPIRIDGLKMDIASGAAAAGDVFVIKPYATAAGAMGTAISSARALAAASPVEARAGSTNTGSVAVGSIAATSANANLTSPVTLTFTAAGTFNLSGSGTGNATGVAYTPGQPLSYNGWTLTLSGTPKAGDTLTVQATTTGYSSGNAGNASAMLSLRDKAVFDGAAMTDGYAALIAQVGVRAQSAQYASSVSGAVATSLETQRTGVSGVNLDEEAAKLLQFQQAYQASAKMIQIAQGIFDSLLKSLG